MITNQKRKIELIYYVCGAHPKKDLKKEVKVWINNNPEIEKLRSDVIKDLRNAKTYAGKGIVHSMRVHLEEIENMLRNEDLIFPNKIKNEIIKIGLLNGVPREFKLLSDALDHDKKKEIFKHWKYFSSYVEMLKSYFYGPMLTKGENMVLNRWIGEYRRLKEIIKL
ncbi:MAG: hypothetical protein GF329_19800 [Candidatus Lokiarchaeota archaeon]|nr:hypothetical protein [Candidatus Lokiarchaeota archaeon]